ncbi:MAG: hypothetical protein ABIS27_11055 [Longimicrobiales bacterium]
MRISNRISALLALLLATSAPVHGQEYAVSRQTFSFYADNLDIDVVAKGAGRLQILRGPLGRVDVAAHSRDGVAGFGLTDAPSVLRLAALGGEGASYIVVVPDLTNIRVKLPGRRGWQHADRYGSPTFKWDSVPDAPDVDESMPRPTMDGRYFVATTRMDAPERVRLLNGAHIRSVELRLEGTEFRIAASRAFQPRTGSASLIDIDAGSEDVDLVIQVPAYTRRFELQLGSERLAAVADGKLSDLCRPSIQQVSPAGFKRVTYRPALGVSCGVKPPVPSQRP